MGAVWMPKVANKFELSLSVQEIVMLFFVMVALFTGLLFFGYRVGNAHNRNTVEAPSTPMAPAQESPSREQEAPAGVPGEPEIRLENTSPDNGGDSLPASNPGDPGRESSKPLALGGEAPHPCKADAYWSFLRKTLPSKHRFFERVADWAGVPPAEDTAHAGKEQADESGVRLVPDADFFQIPSEPSEAVECGPPPPRLTGRSVAC
jgi:hypothetical protein